MANITEMVKELQQERDRLDQAVAALARLAGTSKASSARSGASGPRRTLSAVARRKVSLAQRARWAKLRAENSAKGQPSTVNPGKRTMSAAARRKIAAAQRARWAKLRGGRCAVPRRVPAALSRRTGLSEHSARFAHRSWSRGLCRQSRHLCSPLSAWDLVGWQERARLRQGTSERNRFQPLLRSWCSSAISCGLPSIF